MRVLIVDGDKTFCQLLGTVFKRQGIEVERTTDSLVCGVIVTVQQQFADDLTRETARMRLH